MRELAIRDDDGVFVRLWQPEQHDRIRFVTHITEESANRYKFELTDPGEKRCVYSKGAGTTPPRVVIELLNEYDYTITNLPNLYEDDPIRRGLQLGEAIQWLQSHGGFEAGDIREFAYSRSSNVTPVIWSSAMMMDVLGPQRFHEVLDQVLEKATQHGRNISKGELLEPRTHDIEFLQDVVFEMRRALPIEEQQDVIDLAKTYGLEEGEDTADIDMGSVNTHSENVIQMEEEAAQLLRDTGWMKR